MLILIVSVAERYAPDISMLTLTVSVAVSVALSVTVHLRVPERVPEFTVRVVDCEEGELIVMPVPPDAQSQA